MSDDGKHEGFEAAVAAVKQSPDDDGAWDEVEQLAGTLDRPDDVAALYREVLSADIDDGLVLRLGERAANFYEEWFGDDPARLEAVLVRVLDIDPRSEWALERLTVVYTVTARWDDLLGLYDRALAAATDPARRIRLLDEAAQVAKDVANQPDKAIDYLQRLVPLRPDDQQLAQSLERLLERHERWRDLIGMWEAHLEGQTAEERKVSRARIAACWLDNLGEPAQALAAARPLLSEEGDDREACALLERIIAAADAAVRDSALAILRAHYEETGRPREIVRVLETVIEVTDRAESAALREEAGERLAALGDDEGAMGHYAALLALDPTSSVTQEKMRQIAQRSGAYDAYARGVAAAAEGAAVSRKVALLSEAARTRLDLLDDDVGAIDLYRAAMAQEGIDDASVRQVARRLAELLARVDRPADRLEVLERLASVETAPAARRAVLGDAARLAEALGETERALTAWRGRIEVDPGDRDALDGTISLLEKEAQWEPLLAALEQRIAQARSAGEKRADMVRVAIVCERQLGAPDRAVEAWRRVQAEFGEDPESVDALADLLTGAERWAELAELLERASGRERERVTDRLVRLASACGEHLDAPERALAAYRAALLIEPSHEQARAGMMALLGHDQCRAAAAETLAQVCRATGDWPRFLELTEPRLADAAGAEARLEILREAAAVSEREVGDPAGAARALAQALPLAPRDRALEAELCRLARATDQLALVADAYRAAAAQVAGDAHELVRLRAAEAALCERDLDDPVAACAALAEVIALEPANLSATAAIVRLGSRLGRWEDVAGALLSYTAAREALAPELFAEMEEVAGSSDAFDPMTAALESALARAEVPPTVAVELNRRIAQWHRDRRGDERAAETAFRRALALGGGGAEALRALAELQRPGQDRALLDTLRRLADADPDDLDVVFEAARLSLELGDAAEARSSLSTLLGRATAAWRGTAQMRSSSDPDVVVAWASEKLVDNLVAGDAPGEAVDLLIDGARLPFDEPTRRAMRLRAASIAADRMGDNSVAIEMYRGVLVKNPEDTEAMDKLAELLLAEDRVAELLSLRQRQLGLETGGERRLALRLEIARLVGEVEARGGRLNVLRANLDDSPGHAASIDALCALLDDKGQHRTLADLLEEQAGKLEALGQSERSAELWERVAEVAERQLRDLERAVAAHRRVAALRPTRAALAALARLCVEREQPAQAVPWLERLLAESDGDERKAVVAKLAAAHLGAEQRDRAIAALEANLPDDEPAMELRAMLADLYKQAEAWEPLARLYTRSLTLVDEATAVAYAREAAAIYGERLDQPDEAIPALEKALSLDPTSRELRTQLAIGLRIAGRAEEARTILTGLVKEFGRRRSPERAAVHVQLGLVAQREGDREGALEQLELAAKMDTGNAGIQKMVADLAREAGKLDKAERTYRALLLVVRRQPPGDDVEAVGVSEVLYELHRLAAEQGKDDQAAELRESALQSAAASDAEVHRLRRTLIASGEHETLLRALQLRLEAAEETGSQVQLLSDIAAVQDAPLGKSAEALDALLQALVLVPDRLDLHDRARELAQRTGAVERYLACVDQTVDRLRRKEDPPLVAELLMRAGGSVEQAGEPTRALALYRRVEESGERTAEACFAIARVAEAQGDAEERDRALDRLLALASADESSAVQINALYRLAEVFVRDAERREQGISLLEQAYDADPRHAEAAATLCVAADAEPDSGRVMALYERVARAADDSQMLLDFLERRAVMSGATPAEVKEAVDLAVARDERPRAEALLERAVDAARDSVDGVAGAVWAVTALAERRAADGQLSAARVLYFDIADIAEPAQVETLGLSLAAQAAAVEEHRALAAEIYEHLRQRDPGARAVWEPLVALYRELGDGDRLQDVIGSTLPALVEPSERNALRMQHAAYLIEVLDRADDAVEVLKDALLDDPDHREAASRLEDVLRGSGDRERLADFLWQRFEDARERRNPETIADAARPLGALLDEMSSDEAVGVYRAALEIAPRSPELLRAVLDHLDPDSDPEDRARLMERLLEVADQEEAATTARQLLTLRRAQHDGEGDVEGVRRALELGHRAAPGDAGLHRELETFYRDQQLWRPLAAMMIADAERVEATATAVARLREAAEVHRDLLGDPLAAAAALRRAHERAPADGAVVMELAGCLSVGGDVGGAVEAISEALGGELSGRARVDLLRTRAHLHASLGDDAAAVTDLEEALSLDPGESAGELAEALERRRASARAGSDRDGERSATMRLARLSGDRGDTDRARELLGEWVEVDPGDREALYLLRDLETAAKGWDGVLTTCARLVMIEEGDAQIDAAVRLAQAAERADRAAEARAGLEHVHHAQPHSEVVREHLRRIYELSGAHRELAAVLLADAEHAADDGARYDAYRRAAELLLYSVGDPDAAALPAQQARTLRPDDHAALVLQVDALTAAARVEEAVAVLEPAIAEHKRRSPELGALQQRMGRIAAVAGDRDTQLAWLKKAFDVDRKSGEIAAELAQLATEVGDYDLALKPLRAITLMEEPGPISRVMALLWEAKIEHARGNRAKAELWAKKALREDPNFADAQEFLNEINQ